MGNGNELLFRGAVVVQDGEVKCSMFFNNCENKHVNQTIKFSAPYCPIPDLFDSFILQERSWILIANILIHVTL